MDASCGVGVVQGRGGRGCGWVCKGTCNKEEKDEQGEGKWTNKGASLGNQLGRIVGKRKLGLAFF